MLDGEIVRCLKNRKFHFCARSSYCYPLTLYFAVSLLFNLTQATDYWHSTVVLVQGETLWGERAAANLCRSYL